MKAVIDAIRTLLVPTGWTVYFVDVPAPPPMPYVLLWTSSGRPAIEGDVTGARADMDDQIGVTCVAALPDGVLTLQAGVRAALFPGGLPRTLVAGGRSVALVLDDSRPIAVDRDVTIAATGKHPAFGIDLVRMISTPV